MRLLTSPYRRLSHRQISVAAQNIAASQFALYGFDVLEQGGHAKSAYDLGVANSGGMMKVSVQASVDGFWSLVDRYVDQTMHLHASRTDYHRAIELWVDHHSSRVSCCLVQFESANLNGMPRIYLASALEIAEKLHENTERLGDPALYEEYEITDAEGTHGIERLPSAWRLSLERIEKLMEPPQDKAPLRFRFSAAIACAPCATSPATACVECLPMMN